MAAVDGDESVWADKKVTLRYSDETPPRKLVCGAFSKRMEELEFVDMAAETERVRYTFEKESDEGRKMQYAVGVYDAKTKSINLSRAEVYQLVVTPKLEKEDVEVDRTLEGRIKMAEQFGSSKKQKQLKARLANQIQVDAKTAADLEDTFDSLRKDDRKITTDRRVAASNAPPRNPEAKTPLEMYDWDALYRFEDLSDQIEALDKFQSGLPRNPENLLLRHMIVFYKEKDRGSIYVPDYSRSNNIPEIIVKRFLEQFTTKLDGNKYSRPKTLRNKLAMRILLLALKVNDFTLDTKDFADTLGTEPSRLTQFLKELGCDVNKNSAELVVVSKKRTKSGTETESNDNATTKKRRKK